MMEEKLQRLQKYLSGCGLLSRRHAEEAIRAGRVKVNGQIAQFGQKVDPDGDEICFDGKQVLPPADHLYILLHKPVGYVTTLSDEEGRPCVADLIKDVGRRVYPVGRLDLRSQGLLLLTDDGDLALRLTHPRHAIPKYYEVTVASPVTKEQLQTLRSPLFLDGYPIRPVECRVLWKKPHSTGIGMTLYEGRNRQIRRMCEQAGLEIQALKRVAIGALTLENLPCGAWRPLTAAEIAYLKGKEIPKKKRK